VVDTANGVVTDTVTGLVWQEPTPSGTFAWENARCYCAGLTLAGRQDWRLPTRIELISLLDETIASAAPHINSVAFPSTVGGNRSQAETGYGYWTSTPKAGEGLAAWNVHFDYYYGGDTYEDATLQERVRCVRRPEQSGIVPNGHFTIRNGTVHDNFTALTWQEAIPTTGGDDSFGGYTWSNAKSYCAQLGLDGGGWRVPRVKELSTIVDDTTENPAIDSSAFPAISSELFWTSTLVAGYSTAGLLVDFAAGGIADDGVQYTYRVRCVR
jgi:hypothetical protein